MTGFQGLGLKKHDLDSLSVLLISLIRQLIRDVKKERINILATDLKLEVTYVLNIGICNEIGMIFNIILHNEIRNHIKLKSVKKVRINYFFLFLR